MNLRSLLSLAVLFYVTGCNSTSPASTTTGTTSASSSGTTGSANSGSSSSTGGATTGASSSTGASSTGSSSSTGGATTGSSTGSSTGGSPWIITGQIPDPGGATNLATLMTALPGPAGQPAVLFSDGTPDFNLYFWAADGTPQATVIFDAGGAYHFLMSDAIDNGAKSAVVCENDSAATQQLQALVQSGGVWTPVSMTGVPLVDNLAGAGIGNLIYDQDTGTPWLIAERNNMFGGPVSYFAAPVDGTGAFYPGPTINSQLGWFSASRCNRAQGGRAVICIVYVTGGPDAQQLQLAVFDPDVATDGGAIIADGGSPFAIQTLIADGGGAGFFDMAQVAVTAADAGIAVFVQGSPLLGGDLIYAWATFMPGGAPPVFAPFLFPDGGGSGAPSLLTWQDQTLLAYGYGGFVFLDGTPVPSLPPGVGRTPGASPAATYVDATGNLVFGSAAFTPDVGGIISIVTLSP